jgi:hypothetical protein
MQRKNMPTMGGLKMHYNCPICGRGIESDSPMEEDHLCPVCRAIRED